MRILALALCVFFSAAIAAQASIIIIDKLPNGGPWGFLLGGGAAADSDSLFTVSPAATIAADAFSPFRLNSDLPMSLGDVSLRTIFNIARQGGGE